MPLTSSEQTLFSMVKSQLEQFGYMLGRHDEVLSRLPRDISRAFSEHRETCEAYKHFDDFRNQVTETTGVVSVHEERIRAAQERLAKDSRYPKGKAPWYAPIFVKIGLAIVGALSAGGLGAWGVHCSSTKPPESDTARGGPAPIVQANR